MDKADILPVEGCMIWLSSGTDEVFWHYGMMSSTENCVAMSKTFLIKITESEKLRTDIMHFSLFTVCCLS